MPGHHAWTNASPPELQCSDHRIQLGYPVPHAPSRDLVQASLELQAAADPPLLLDVREPWEAQTAPPRLHPHAHGRRPLPRPPGARPRRPSSSSATTASAPSPSPCGSATRASITPSPSPAASTTGPAPSTPPSPATNTRPSPPAPALSRLPLNRKTAAGTNPATASPYF